MPTSAPASRAFSSPSPSWIPLVTASEAVICPRRMAVQRSGINSSSGELSFNCDDISSSSRSMSGWMKRLNITRASAPASVRRWAMFANALK